MGHGYQPRRLCHHNIHQRTTTTTATAATFLPTLCRVSINDVKLTQHKSSPAAAAASTATATAASFSDDPSSPRVSCIGQVKRNNKVLGFPTPHHNVVVPDHSYSFKNPNLKRLFAGKSLTPTTVTAAGCRRASRNCTRRSSRKVNNKDSNSSGGGVDINELDPPLPVVKKVQQPCGGGGEASLWKRRSGGGGLKSLQIQLDKSNQLIIPPSTV
ncbi:PREDICTED: uncharacterized protein LOC109175420 [Ipomoea nil]|uniref:uncharacterized protein LOC109175420 n=1 Tax=Ipomoea nil TaxID=35883 RepID=UPI000900B542|nr:PREDICTED: uncharacterized protein LOC109175420 [Ipomoea nil]